MSGLEGIILALKSVGAAHEVYVEREWTTVAIEAGLGGSGPLLVAVDMNGTVLVAETVVRRFRRNYTVHTQTDIVSMEWWVWASQTADKGVR